MIWTIIAFALQAILAFVVSTALFDVLHWVLHRWETSRFKLLRTFSSWHWVHHKFLGLDMQINPAYARANIWFHILPEYLTSILGTLTFLVIFPWPPIALVVVIRTVMLVMTLKEEGLDYNHMSMSRVGGQQGLLWVDNNYHAMHHVYPHNFFSSFSNVFDLIAGTACQIKGRRFLVTGASGAFGSAMVEKLQKAGGIVETAKSGVDFSAGNSAAMREKLERADVLILAHGAKTEDTWNANYVTFTDLIDLFTDLGKSRLAPPEVWALGSEVEFHGDMGMAELKAYSASKRAFALRARDYYRSDALLYRHIVPSSFTSPMGKGAMSAGTAASIALFFIRRGFKYVPVTLTGLAVLNFFRFRFSRNRRLKPSRLPSNLQPRESPVPYDPSNIFAKILNGEIPAHKVYEDEAALVMMDIFPQSRGHLLIIPKAASRNLLDAAPETLSAVMPLVQRIAKAVLAATGADGLRLAQFNEAPAGQTVFHLHFHLIPVYEGTALAQHAGGKADDAELADLAKAIAAKL